MKRPVRLRVLGTPLDAVNIDVVLELVEYFVRGFDSPATILAVNPEKVYALRRNPFLREFFEQATLLIPDGIGMVVALRWLHGRKVARLPGADLMERLCAVAPDRGYRIFIYGASEEVNAGAVGELSRRYPGIGIVGRANGYIEERDMPALVRRINDSGADILFVALGSPKQEQWMHRWLPEIRVKVCQGIGGTLDTIVGNVRRAPRAFQAFGFEWLYRLLQQPSRAGRQLRLIRFAADVFAAKVCKRERATQPEPHSVDAE